LNAAPEHALDADDEAVPAAGVPEQLGFTGWVSVISSITTQQSGVVPTMAAWMRTKMLAPLAGTKVEVGALLQLELDMFVKVPAVVHGPLEAVAHCTVKVTEPAGVAVPAVLVPVYCCTL
jgi:hypothetical protein